MGNTDFTVYRKNSEGVFFSQGFTVSAGSFSDAAEKAVARYGEMSHRPISDGEYLLIQCGEGGNMWLMRAAVPTIKLERV